MLARSTRTLFQLTRAAATIQPARVAMPSFNFVNVQGRSFAADESKFDGHDDFASKSKVNSTEDLNKQIDTWVNENDVCLFMKGDRKMPRCGFSSYVVQIFKFYGVKEYKTVNVLEDEALRSQIKEYSNWPTIPQVYIKG